MRGLWICLLLGLAGPVDAAETCRRCHQPAAAGRAHLDAAALQSSVHAGLECTDCHSQLSGHGPTRHGRVGPASCVGCHEAAARKLAGSAHGGSRPAGKQLPRCQDCHGGHRIMPAGRATGSSFRRESTRACARCHAGAARSYLADAHGSRLLGKGLVVAAGCVDCHGGHGVKPRAALDRAEVSRACGQCHRGTLQTWTASVHGPGHGPGRSCLDCHSAHDITAVASSRWRQESARRCGACHRSELASFRSTFHGKAHTLQQQRGASCHDCHGAHGIVGAEAAGSPVARGARLQTCRRCHPGAPAGLASYLPHPDHTDRVNFAGLYWTHQILMGLIIAVFICFGIHSVLWLVRSLIFRVANPQGYQTEREWARHQGAGKIYVRFSPVDRFTHVLVMVSFVLLVVTGMPLRYPDASWGRWLVENLGGLEMLRMLHRLGAILSLIYLGMHLWSLAQALRRNRPRFSDETGRFRLRAFLRFAFGPDSPMPNRQDFRDFWAHQKWFLGSGPRPQFDRWTYWEKFDYLAVFWGLSLFGISGLMLWFPGVSTAILPGWALNIAAIAHSAEALLAAAFIVSFHFFNVHLRVDKFPLDATIFTGRITEEELLNERRRLYDRLLSEGRLAEERRRGSTSAISILWFAVGVLSLLVVVWSLAGRLVV